MTEVLWPVNTGDVIGDRSLVAPALSRGADPVAYGRSWWLGLWPGPSRFLCQGIKVVFS